jgi:hypothetical protein
MYFERMRSYQQQDFGVVGDSNMYSICCTLPKTDYQDLIPEHKQRVGFLIHQFRNGILYLSPEESLQPLPE